MDFPSIFVQMVRRAYEEGDELLPEYDRDPTLENKTISELMHLVFENLDLVTSFEDVNILLDARIWIELPWGVATVIFPHIFRQGERDTEFLKLCRDYFETAGGPDGEPYLDEFRTELKKEGREDLCQYLEYDSGG